MSKSVKEKVHCYRKRYCLQLYVAKFSTVSLYLTKHYVTKGFAITSSEIRQNLSNSVG